MKIKHKDKESDLQLRMEMAEKIKNPKIKENIKKGIEKDRENLDK